VKLTVPDIKSIRMKEKKWNYPPEAVGKDKSIGYEEIRDD
jgi:hypothetical protein